MPNMPQNLLTHIKDKHIHLLGAKGTGMCALAEILVAQGANLRGSDTSEIFYTDKILNELGITVDTFDNAVLPEKTHLVIHSAAYDTSNELLRAANERHIPLLTYPEALGLLSASRNASAIAGVHGKTTTTALVGTLVKALNIPATVLVGSAVAGFGNRCTWQEGNQFFIAETCEYRRHFLHYHPNRILLTNIESDHQDYYPDLKAIQSAFTEFLLKLAPSGELIYCQDSDGAREVVETVIKKRPDIRSIAYGESATGTWKIESLSSGAKSNKFRIAGFDNEFQLKIPGRHIALDAVGALALIHTINPHFKLSIAIEALSSFRGSRRRSEIIGEHRDILIMDDYAHHPTAISETLKGLREFYPERRLLVDFMPHTYSRTLALIDDFAACFEHADILSLHPIYSSAREKFSGEISGEELARRASTRRKNRETLFHRDFNHAFNYWMENIHPGDLFITLGAGNNFVLGQRIYEAMRNE